MKKIALALIAVVAFVGCNSKKATTPAGAPAGPGGAGNYCDVARAADAKGDEFGGENFDPTKPEAIKKLFTEIEVVFAQQAAAAPSEIKADVTLLANAFQRFIAAARRVNFNFADPSFAAAGAELQSTDFQAASERIDAYNARACGIEADKPDS